MTIEDTIARVDGIIDAGYGTLHTVDGRARVLVAVCAVIRDEVEHPLMRSAFAEKLADAFDMPVETLYERLVP